MNRSPCCFSCACRYGTDLLAWTLSFEWSPKVVAQSGAHSHFGQKYEVTFDGWAHTA